MSLKLTIYSNIKVTNEDHKRDHTRGYYDLSFTYDASKIYEARPEINNKTYNLSLVHLDFNKQMYQPGEIHARLQFYLSGATQTNNMYFLFDQKTLNDYLLGCKIKLGNTAPTPTDPNHQDEIASGYFVYEIIPQYTSTSLYVDLKIFSPDKLMTLNTYCRSYVAQRLGKDILKAEDAKFKLPYDKNSTVPFSLALQNQLKNDSDEFLQPYLVQYNESFYDMLARTANRWGEFLYYEFGTLVLGRTGSEKVINTYHSISYHNNRQADPLTIKLNQRQTADPATLNGLTDTDKALRKDTVTQDEYLAKISQSDDYITHAGDLKANDRRFSYREIQSFLNLKTNIWDWALDCQTNFAAESGENDAYIKAKNEQYSTTYFPSNPTKDLKEPELSRVTAMYDQTSSPTGLCQFSNYATQGLKAANYETVLANELIAGKGMICIDLDATYQHLCLGDLICFKGDSATNKTFYVIVQIDCRTEQYIDGIKMNAETGKNELVYKNRLHFLVYAIKQTADNTFYPAMLPTGHVRFSGPQSAIVTDAFDPQHNDRYRVKYSWQTADDAASPWLQVAHEMMGIDCGAVWQIRKNSEVLLNYEDGNIERPYIVGVLQNSKFTAPRSSLLNSMSFTTPAGHALRLTDGYGAGSDKSVASIFPLADLVKKFKVAGDPTTYEEKGDDWLKTNAAYEGGIELTDKFGLYTIKASTDERNISISSPFGDVNLNAFTGITISAPNGDIKIIGKNVSIEAGNNLTLLSGKNIENEIVGGNVLSNMTAEDPGSFFAGAGTAILKTIGDKALSYFDTSFFRHVLEVILRPVVGSMEIRSDRAMVIKAGISIKQSSHRIDETKPGEYGKWFASKFSVLEPFINGAFRNDKSAWEADHARRGTLIIQDLHNDDDNIMYETNNQKEGVEQEDEQPFFTNLLAND